jgi:hypothetical protein
MNERILEAKPLGILDTFPIWELYIGMALILLLSFEVGFQISKYTASSKDKEGFNSTSPMVSGLLAMLAFVLAFTFAMAASQHNLRKQNVLKEANIIGTAYLRADLLGQRDEMKVKELLKEYVNSRVYAIEMGSVKEMEHVLVRSLEIHALLWELVSSAAKEEPNLYAMLVLQSINDVIDMHQSRVTAGFYNRIPYSVWLALLAISALTMMTMGAQARLAKSRRLAAVIPLILAFTTLTEVVLDLDRPNEGFITVGQEAMVDLQKGLKIKSESE